MKKITILVLFVTSFTFSQVSNQKKQRISFSQEFPVQAESTTLNGCIEGTKYPISNYSPQCNGDDLEIINNDCFAGEYVLVNVNATQMYNFSSSVLNDYIKITNASGTTIYASGQSPLLWVSNTTSAVRYYIHKDSNCTAEEVNRTRFITCGPLICHPPTSVAVLNTSPNSALIDWTAPLLGPAEKYQVYMKTTNSPPLYETNGNEVIFEGTIINGLNPNMTYYYWVRSVCATTKSHWIYGGIFNTVTSVTCNNAPYSQYPEATFSPQCSGSVEKITDEAWAGEFSSVNVIQNTSYIFTSSVATDYLTITNTAGTTILSSGTTPLSWNSGSTNAAVRLYTHTGSTCGTEEVNRVRAVQCSAAQFCSEPTTLTVGSITVNGAQPNWTAVSSASNTYDYILTTSTAIPVANSPITNTVSSLNVVLSELLPATTYRFWVRANCGSTKSTWKGTNFTTLPACTSGTLYPTITYIPNCLGFQELIVSDAYAGEYSNINVIPNKYYTFFSGNMNDFITVTNATGTIVYTSAVGQAGWNSGSNSGIVRFYIHTNSSCGMQDTNRSKSVSCQNTEFCYFPLELTPSAPTATTVTLDWTASEVPSNGYDYYISTSSATPGFVDNPGNTTSLTAIVTGLNPSTVYYCWVRSNCEMSTSGWRSGGSFTTLPICTSGTLFPPTAFTPECNGSAETISTSSKAGNYANVSVNINSQYTFTSSVTTDFITITSENGQNVLKSGLTPVVLNSGNFSGILRFFIHANASCGVQNVNRTSKVSCTTTCTTPIPIANSLSLCGSPTVASLTANGTNLKWYSVATNGTALAASGSVITGTYYVSQTINGCESGRVAVSVSVNPNVTPVFTAVAAICSGTILPALPTTSNNGINGTWSPALDNMATKTYTFTPTPGQCATVRMMTITVNSPATPIFNVVAAICSGATLPALPITSNNGITGVWSPALNNSETTLYTFTPNAGQCASVKVMSITVNNLPDITITDNGETAVAATSGGSYQWINCSDNSDIAGETNQVFTPSTDGSYAVRITKDTCSATSECVSLMVLGTGNPVLKDCSLYPNPSYGVFTVDTGNLIADEIVLIDNLGRIISHVKPFSVQTTINAKSYATGSYFVKIIHASGEIIKKLILQN